MCQMKDFFSWCLEFIFWVSMCHTWVILTGSAFCSKNNELSFPLWKHANAINLPPGSWLLTLGNGAMPELASAVSRLGTQQWLQPGQLCELEHMSLCLCILCIPATMATLLMNILDNDRSGWGNKSASIYRTDPTKRIVTTIPPFWDHPLLIIYISNKYFSLDTHLNAFTYLSFSLNCVATTFYSHSFQIWHHHDKLFVFFNWCTSCNSRHNSFWIPLNIWELSRFALVMVSRSHTKWD